MTLPLTLPHPGSGQRFALGRTELRDWLNGLPLGNAPEAARCVLRQLAPMNRTRLGARARVALADVFREKAEAILPALEAELALATLPLSGRLRSAAGVADELLVEVAYAYKTALVALSDTLVPVGVRRHLQVAVLQTMRALARRLAVGYRIYAPAPKTVWQELHLLFHLAAKRRTAETLLPDRLETPSSVYRGALLLAFAEPYRLMQGDVDRILGYLASFVDRSGLVPHTGASDGPGVFLIRPGRDAPGTALAKSRPAAPGSSSLALNCLPLVEGLLDQIEKLESGVPCCELGLPANADEPMYRDLMQRLARQWGNVATRQFGRLRTHTRVEILVGLRAIWNFLTGSHGPSDADSNAWMVTNECPGGFALMHESGTPEPIRVGEVVAVRTLEACHICFVRWVLSDNPGHLELGLQQFAPGATPVGLGSEDAAESEPALLLPEIPALHRAAAILALYGQVDASREFLMDDQDTRLRVRATKLLEQTLSFQMFHFSAAGMH